MKREIILMVSIVGLVLSVYVFMVGWHNVDIAYNMVNLKLLYNETYIDANAIYGSFTSDQLHGIGMTYLEYAVGSIAFFGVVTGYLVKRQN
jgi:hypothetical protein